MHILVGEGKAKPVDSDALGLPADEPVDLQVEAGREEVHRVGTPLPIGVLEHRRIELEI